MRRLQRHSANTNRKELLSMWEGRRLLAGEQMTFHSDNLGWILQKVHHDKNVVKYMNCRWTIKYVPIVKTV